MAQLVPLSLTVSCSSKIQIGFTFLVPAHSRSPGKKAVKWVCVCVCRHVKKQSSTEQEKLMKDDAHMKVAAEFMRLLSFFCVMLSLGKPVPDTQTHKPCCVCTVKPT